MSTSGTDLRIVAVDPFDDAALEAWHATYAVAEAHGYEDTATVWQLEEVRALMQAPASGYRIDAWNGLLGTGPDAFVVAAGWMRTPRHDNLDRADLSVHVLPAHRRRGHGTRVLAHLEQVARERGRSILLAEAHYAYAAGPAGAGECGPEFARARGYALGLGDVQRRLRLPVAAGLLDRLAAEAAPHHAAYTLRSWVGPVPDELLDGWAEVTASLTTEAPVGELALEPERPDPVAVREHEAVLTRQGRRKYNTVALAPDGTVAAYTDLVTTVHEPGRAYQWGTLVRRAHRGHRLGLAVKVANLRLLQAGRPDLTHLLTYNAEVNDHMVAVNDLLGFEPVARLGEFQKRL
ncbi:GNAT family N-acetyltransferase [Nocardioides marmotae]|uniref:GNAT family N-acetyltransferase n=1 Tax=Nocardioides marmotae TaxID=2663857 RepID=UPI0012B57830|nr:GNAT family N-acetyltransferase [Nocardioides marmotae]MBC9733766.1 GNAT family N-acetyltransferase [Nocardioides marmotae]MTB84869.1 GNAT family N-acetyltransferase [Nocardioides marmotae]